MNRLLLLISALLVTCQADSVPEDRTIDLDWETVQDSTDRVAVVTGLSEPEAVRYDVVSDLFFVSNFNGDGDDRDTNGFISRANVDGTLEELLFAVGTDIYPLHAPRGMFIQGDTLWAVDIDGIHGFNRLSGEQLKFVDFRTFEPGFLNDVASGPLGALYITDTGRSRIYRMLGDQVTIAVEDSLLGQPNGITWFGDVGNFLLAPWGGRQVLKAWNPTTGEISEIVNSTGGYFDGIEVVNGEVIVASQADSSLHRFADGVTRQIVRVAGSPADIGVDVRRNRVAVPYIDLNRVDIWQLPVP